MKTILVKLTIAFLIGALAAVATYDVITRQSWDNRVLSAPGSPGPLF